AADRAAWQAKTGRAGTSQEGRAVAMLLRPHEEESSTTPAVVVEDVRLFRTHGHDAYRYPEPDSDDLDALCADLAPGDEGTLRGDAILPAAAQSRVLSAARPVSSGRSTGTIRV